MDLVPTLSPRSLIQLWRLLQWKMHLRGVMCLLSVLCPVDLQDTASLTQKFTFNPKLGIDNPVLSLAEDQDHSDLWKLERPRFCLLSKEEGKSFGFHLQQQLGRVGHVVCRVEPGTSAQRQGLREGDRILAVNNDVVEHEDYVVVVRYIRASGPRVLLTVLAQHVHDVARAQQGNDTQLCPPLNLRVRPRLCHIVKDEGGFGFSVTHGARGPFWLVLSAGGAAERAGVPPGARLLEVNGISVEKFTSNQLNRKLWQSGDQVTLLVAGPEVEEECRKLGMPLAPPLAEGWALPARPRCLHLEKGPQGFGFLLREEKGLNGHHVETEDPPVEGTAEPPGPIGPRQCFLYPGPGGGYGFRLCCVASGPSLFIS
uniref:Na(+)/H(+) exchange regulatory cofactor NHE-RF4 isoform X3 n=1 Tax=Jaculus jaculus TaxID=51337 RepID=UPI001E1B0458|nr:Na(+)/H(+) exchange regulatory cofactor NHE-RF4 isoform X3 [Jaculus jaculus]